MPTRKRTRGARAAAPTRTLDARPDTLDFRDRMFEPTLIEVPVRRTLQDYRKRRVPILDQGTDGACTVDFYRQHYLPAMRTGQLQRLSLFTLTDKAERDDHCANIYHKSLLYLVSNAFEDRLRKPYFGESEGEPILGMARFVAKLPAAEQPTDWVLSPNAEPSGDRDAARATAHGGFDDDAATLKATLARILGTSDVSAGFERHRSQSSNRERRSALAGTGDRR